MPHDKTLYVLDLHPSHKYVGLTRHLSRRWAAHAAGTDTPWTRLHPPLRIASTQQVPRESARAELRRLTAELMLAHGVNRVRGGTLSHAREYDVDDLVRVSGAISEALAADYAAVSELVVDMLEPPPDEGEGEVPVPRGVKSRAERLSDVTGGGSERGCGNPGCERCAGGARDVDEREASDLDAGFEEELLAAAYGDDQFEDDALARAPSYDEAEDLATLAESLSGREQHGHGSPRNDAASRRAEQGEEEMDASRAGRERRRQPCCPYCTRRAGSRGGSSRRGDREQARGSAEEEDARYGDRHQRDLRGYDETEDWVYREERLREERCERREVVEHDECGCGLEGVYADEFSDGYDS